MCYSFFLEQWKVTLIFVLATFNFFENSFSKCSPNKNWLSIAFIGSNYSLKISFNYQQWVFLRCFFFYNRMWYWIPAPLAISAAKIGIKSQKLEKNPLYFHHNLIILLIFNHLLFAKDILLGTGQNIAIFFRKCFLEYLYDKW